MKPRRFGTNPIEIILFSVIMSIFLTSIYNLVYDFRGFHPAVLNSGLSPSGQTTNRSLASVGSTSPLQSIDFKCEDATNTETKAQKIRFTGTLCTPEGLSTADKAALSKSSVSNVSAKFSATVFADPISGKFATDYIPLVSGKNTIKVEFSFAVNGVEKTASREVLITKN